MKIRTSLVLSIILLIVDRLLKVAALRGLLEGSFWSLGYPRFSLYENHAAVFSIPIPNVILIVVSAVIIVAIIAVVARHREPTPAWVFICAGAAANLFDRIRYGFVIDMIEIIPRSVWNIADGMIILGIAMILLTKKLRAYNRG